MHCLQGGLPISTQSCPNGELRATKRLSSGQEVGAKGFAALGVGIGDQVIITRDLVLGHVLGCA